MSTSDEALNQELTRDPDLWFEDGNTVVIAQKVAFRVHRSILSRHSDTFSGLFTIPQPQSPESIHDCSVVHVADPAHDFKHLLHALYDGLDYLRHDKRMEFSELAALARLGHRYGLDTLLAGVCSRLAPIFLPSSRSFNPFAWGAETSLVKLSVVNAIEAVNIFRLLGRDDMVPAAFYACCQLAPTTLIRGIKRADGTPERLGLSDFERCIEARETLTTCYAWRFFTLFEAEVSDTCSTRGTCMRTILRIRQSPSASKLHICRGTPALSSFVCMIAHLFRDQVICKECRDMLIRRDKSAQRAVWEQLPKMMDLKVDDWPPFDGDDWWVLALLFCPATHIPDPRLLKRMHVGRSGPLAGLGIGIAPTLYNNEKLEESVYWITTLENFRDTTIAHYATLFDTGTREKKPFSASADQR